MERLPSLINSLKIKYESGAGTGDLLAILDEMRNELVSSNPPMDHTLAPVSVWLPAGYTKIDKENIHDHLTVNQAIQQDAASVPKLGGSQLKFGMLRPPAVTVMEETDDELEIKLKNENETVKNGVKLQEKEYDSPLELMDTLEKIKPVTIDINNEVESGTIIEERVISPNFPGTERHEYQQNEHLEPESEIESRVDTIVLELEMHESEKEDLMEFMPEKPAIIPEGFLSFSPTHVSQVASKPKELHEILASRVVAQPEQGIPKPRILAESLGTQKIADLKKGIAINDRFRFIKSLFRSDESLFERSVKTINNFSILQEAEYWMQRELVIKLGWNEEDELVQEFYLLIKRRFL